MEFTPFPKMPRLSRECTITEKIDGTNASVIVIPDSAEIASLSVLDKRIGTVTVGSLDSTGYIAHIWAGSRTRFITPDSDNYGFARWVENNLQELAKLGPGQHFGEWWGSGIQRGYGLTKGDKRFSLFDTRWIGRDNKPTCCSVVPVLYRGVFSGAAIDTVMVDLAMQGSQAAPGFDRPEGIIVWHEAAKMSFKKTLENDESPKGKQ